MGGGDVVTRKYNPRTQQWDLKVVKVEKEYDYIPVLISKILKRRVNDDDDGGVTRAIDLNASDPALISPTIAHHHLQRKLLRGGADSPNSSRYQSIAFFYCTYINCYYKYI